MENEDKKKGLEALVTFQRELTKQVDEVKGNLSVLDKDNDFLSLPNDRQMKYLAIILDRLEDERKQTFIWLQGYADKYGIALDYSKFEDNYDVFKDDIKPYQEQCNYFLDLANIAIMVKLNIPTKEFKVKSDLMRENLATFLQGIVSNIGFMDLPKRVNKTKLKKEFDNYISSKHPKEQKEFLYSVQKQFLNKYKKNNAVEWLCSIIQGEKYNVKAGAFIYDVLSQIGIFNKKDYQLKPKEKYDLVKNYFTR